MWGFGSQGSGGVFDLGERWFYRWRPLPCLPALGVSKPVPKVPTAPDLNLSGAARATLMPHRRGNSSYLFTALEG